MGNFCNCQHTLEEELANQIDQRELRQISDINDFRLTAQDFIAFQKGRFLDHYDLDKLLGEGAFGQVYKCYNKHTKAVRAVKALLKQGFYNQEERERFQAEVTLLRQMDHPNILKLYEVYQDDARFYVVTELCQGGELFDEIVKRRAFSEKDAAGIMLQILKAVNYCHQHTICHRDLKPENILLESEGRVKVIDFGTAMCFNPDLGMSNILGTPYYMAPEIFNQISYNEKCDIWSLGVILFCMLTGQPPFYGKSDTEVIAKVKLGVYPTQILRDKNISSQAQDLISKLLTIDPDQRISASEALQHDWILQKGVKDTNLVHAKEALQNLQSFHTDQKLQQAVLTYIVSQLLSYEEISNTKQIFQDLDVNHDGKLSREELIIGYKKIYGDFAEEEVDKIMKIADIDGSGEIDYSEWLIATTNRKNLISDEKLQNAFEFFDKDGSGSIDVFELKEVLGVKKLVDDQVWEQLIKDVDADGNGEIDFEEFRTMMTKLIDNEFKSQLSLVSARTDITRTNTFTR